MGLGFLLTFSSVDSPTSIRLPLPNWTQAPSSKSQSSSKCARHTWGWNPVRPLQILFLSLLCGGARGGWWHGARAAWGEGGGVSEDAACHLE
ncbi:hypothetical protein ABZP36_035895 [Zizania latifolia]